MSRFTYDNIDLFFYHSIDFDFARFYSIVKHGIVSKQAALDENVSYYYRNYPRASCRDEFVSVSHFPRTILRYYKIENELYEFNTHKIAFVLDDIDALDKQFHENRKKYTNERHVLYKIAQENIQGILLRERDAKIPIKDLPFNYKYTNIAYFENKIFTTLNFFRDYFGLFVNENAIFYLMGKFREKVICGGQDYQDLANLISKEMQKNISLTISQMTKISNPTLLDMVQLLNNNQFPIYLMNRFDIKPVGTPLKQTDDRLSFIKENHLKIKDLKEEEKRKKLELQFLKQLSPTGCDIFCEYVQGPLTLEDSKLVTEYKRKVLKK